MRLPRNPSSRTRAASGAVAFFVGTALVLAATPAQAAPTGADVEFRVQGEGVVQFASKPFFVALTNHGPETAENIVIKVDVAGLDSAKISIEAPQGCDIDGTIYTCRFGSLLSGENDASFSPLDVTGLAVQGDEPVSAGSYTVVVTSDTPDPDPGNNKEVTVPVTVHPFGVDLHTFAQDVWADQFTRGEPVKPGATAPLVFVFINNGDQTVQDIAWKVSLPRFTSFAASGNPDFCKYNEQRTTATCRIRGAMIAPQGGTLAFADPMIVRVAGDAPGPVSLSGGIIGAAGAAEAPSVSALAAARANEAAAPGEIVTRSGNDPDNDLDTDPSDNAATFSVHTAANPADLAVTAGSGSGAVGATVNIAVKVANKGPASSPGTTVLVSAPSGTELVDMPTGCEFETAGKVARCQGPVEAGEESTGTFAFRILSSPVGTDGKAEISGTLDDPDESNNKATITITISGGLPITGTKVSVIGGVGAAVLVAGVVLFLVARRRRVVLVTPTDDA